MNLLYFAKICTEKPNRRKNVRSYIPRYIKYCAKAIIQDYVQQYVLWTDYFCFYF